MKEDAIPKFHRLRLFPLAIKAKVEKELGHHVKPRKWMFQHGEHPLFLWLNQEEHYVTKGCVGTK